jgi:hypothetical protein
MGIVLGGVSPQYDSLMEGAVACKERLLDKKAFLICGLKIRLPEKF